MSFNSIGSACDASVWLFSVATTLLHISCNNVAWCSWLEKIRIQRCFQRVYNVIGLTNPNPLYLWHWWGLRNIVGGRKRDLFCLYHQHHSLVLMFNPKQFKLNQFKLKSFEGLPSSNKKVQENYKPLTHGFDANKIVC